MAKRAKRMSRTRIVLSAVVTLFVAASLGMFMRGYFRPALPIRSPSLAERLASFKAQPAVGMAANLVPGTVLRPDNMTIFARPAEAFVHPEQLTFQWTPLLSSGKFEDGFSASGEAAADILAYFGLSGSRAQLSASRVASIVTTLAQLERAELSETQIRGATLKPEIVTSLGADSSLVIVQAVLRARSMSIQYQDSRGASAHGEVPKTTIPGTLEVSDTSRTSSDELYAEAVLGYIGMVRIGGPGSALTDECAKDLADSLNAAGTPAKAEGNTVVVEATHNTAPKIAEIGRVTLQHEAAIKDRLRAGDIRGATLAKEKFRTTVLPAEIRRVPRERLTAPP